MIERIMESTAGMTQTVLHDFSAASGSPAYTTSVKNGNRRVPIIIWHNPGDDPPIPEVIALAVPTISLANILSAQQALHTMLEQAQAISNRNKHSPVKVFANPTHALGIAAATRIMPSMIRAPYLSVNEPIPILKRTLPKTETVLVNQICCDVKSREIWISGRRGAIEYWVNKAMNGAIHA